jgi:3-oxoacyl-[acyl-carrier-protein] synthase-1
VLYGHCALTQAIADAKLTPEEVSNLDTGLFTASAGSAMMLHYNLSRMEKLGVARSSPMGVVSSVVGTLSYNLVASFKILGSSCGFASACASSGHALGFAWEEIASGRQKRMLVVGGEDGNFETILPFAAMRALSLNPDPSTASRPFDMARDGFVGAGGAVAMVLESADEAARRDADVYCEMPGWGMASDGYNVAISHPEGSGLVQAMQLALRRSGLQPSEVDYINAHATSTPIGDTSEIRALKTVFGVNQPNSPAISSTKALTGHGLSLASILEAAFCALAIKHGFKPGSANIQNLDPEAEGLNIIRESINERPHVALSNSSGFGGANVALVFKAV